MANSVDPDQTVPIGAVCTGSTLFDSILNLSVMLTLFASILNLSVMLGNYLQQTIQQTSFFRSIFSWHFKG